MISASVKPKYTLQKVELEFYNMYLHKLFITGTDLNIYNTHVIAAKFEGKYF